LGQQSEAEGLAARLFARLRVERKLARGLRGKVAELRLRARIGIAGRCIAIRHVGLLEVERGRFVLFEARRLLLGDQLLHLGR